MALKCLSISIHTFKAVCGIAALCMVGFWTLKFHKNEDVSAIKYISYDSEKEIIYPELSICITSPFISENLLLNSNGNVPTWIYNLYVIGEFPSKAEYRQIEFNNVTLNLLDYVDKINLYMRNGSFLSCTSLKTCPYVLFKNNFNGVEQKVVTKCFGFTVNLKNSGNVNALYVTFKAELIPLLEELGRPGKTVPRKTVPGAAYLSFNYPGQRLKLPMFSQTIWKKFNDSLGALLINSFSMEIVRHRDKNESPCFDDWTKFDDTVLKKHQDVIGCSPPYAKSSKPLCTTQKEINASSFLLSDISNKDYPMPCEEMSSFVFIAQDVQVPAMFKQPQFHFTFPHTIKVIQQIKSVDIHSLIGNIGGYIGLFLGYALIQLPEALVSMYRYLKKYCDQKTRSENSNEIMDIKMMRRNSSMKVQSDKSMDTDTDSLKFLMDEKFHGQIGMTRYIVGIIHEMKQDLEIVSKRVDKNESQISFAIQGSKK